MSGWSDPRSMWMQSNYAMDDRGNARQMSAPRTPEEILAANREAFYRSQQSIYTPGVGMARPGGRPTSQPSSPYTPGGGRQTGSGVTANPYGQHNVFSSYGGARGVGRNVGGAHYEAVAAFMNMSPQDQALLQSQGLAPQYHTMAPSNSYAQDWRAPKDQRDGSFDASQGGMSYAATRNQAFQAMPQQAMAMWNSGGRTSALDLARGVGFTPNGPSANWPQQAAGFLNGGFGNNFQQQNAINTQGAVDQLRQRAAASGDLDRLPYKEARLQRQLEGGRRSGVINDMLAQVQLAQALGGAVGQSTGMQNYMNLFK